MLRYGAITGVTGSTTVHTQVANLLSEMDWKSGALTALRLSDHQLGDMRFAFSPLTGGFDSELAVTGTATSTAWSTNRAA